MLKTARNFFGQLSLIMALLGMGDQTGLAHSVKSMVPNVIDGSNYAINLFTLTYTTPSDATDDSYWGPLISVTKNGETVPFTNLTSGGVTNFDGTFYYPLQYYIFTVANVPRDAFFSQTYTLTWQAYVSNSVVVTNYTEDFILPINPFFLQQPQGQSAFAGSTVTLSASAIHISGYQWQKDGTNLVADGHYIGVTNATLVIPNAQLSDAGQYAVVVSNPNATYTSTAVALAVYKPLWLAINPTVPPAGYQVQVGNADGSPVDTNQIAKLTLYSTTNLAQDISSWEVVTNAGWLTNGLYMLNFPADGSPARFWRAGQQP